MKDVTLKLDVYSKNNTSNAVNAIEFFKSNNLAVQRYLIQNDLQELHALTATNTEIRFSLRFDPDNGFSALLSFLVKNNLKNVNYIDLTVENRMYVRQK